MGNEPGPLRHRLLLALAAAALVGIGGVIGIAANGGSGNTKTKTVTTAAVAPETAPVDPDVAAGAHDFVSSPARAATVSTARAACRRRCRR